MRNVFCDCELEVWLAGLSEAVAVTLGGTRMLVEALRTKTGSRLRNLWSSVSIPLPVAMLLGAILIPHLAGSSSGDVFQSLSKGFGSNLGSFAIVNLSAFFIAGWISTQGSASFGKFGISLSPLLGAGMVCPDTAYASLAPIAGQHRKYMAEVIFGDAGKARNWLSTPKSRFSGEPPNTMLSTFPGMCLVEEMLLQISEGLAL